MKFGRLTVISRNGTHNKLAYWNCICDCGNTHNAVGVYMRKGNVSSCGCLKSEQTIERNTKHGLSHLDEYGIWSKMKDRCINPNAKKFSFYGGRGITVCARWNDFSNFIEDMGKRPSKLHSIDRVNTNGNYEPSNCRWANQKEQCRNTRKNRFVTIGNESKCISEWCEIKGLKPTVIQTRIFRGMTPIEALSVPVMGVGRKNEQYRKISNKLKLNA